MLQGGVESVRVYPVTSLQSSYEGCAEAAGEQRILTEGLLHP